MQTAPLLQTETGSTAGKRHLFRVFHDKEKALADALDDTQIAHEYNRFSVDLAGYYEKWPAIEASCQASPAGGLLVRLMSDLPAKAIHNSLAELLVFLNGRSVDDRIGQPCFVMQPLNDELPDPPDLSSS